MFNLCSIFWDQIKKTQKSLQNPPPPTDYNNILYTAVDHSIWRIKRSCDIITSIRSVWTEQLDMIEMDWSAEGIWCIIIKPYDDKE